MLVLCWCWYSPVQSNGRREEMREEDEDGGWYVCMHLEEMIE
jgi:hypothetical protein